MRHLAFLCLVVLIVVLGYAMAHLPPEVRRAFTLCP